MHRTLSLLLLSTTLAAQIVPPGYGETIQNLPAGVGNVLLVPQGLIWFNGTTLVLDDGTSQRTLLSFPSSVFGSFTIDVGGNAVLFGESSGGGVWWVPVSPQGQPRKLADVLFNYDACAWTSTHALISAKTGGFTTPDNDILAIDLTTGAIDVVAVLPGASGPVVLDRAGGLIYGTASLQFPTPPGSTDILRFTAAQLASAIGPHVLTLQDAAVLHRGLDAAGALMIDDDDDLFVVDWMNQTVVELDDIRSGPSQRRTFLSYPAQGPSATSLQFVPTGGISPESFEPYQPRTGGEMLVFESTFNGPRQLRRIQPQRSNLAVAPASPVPAGPFMLTLERAPPGAAFTFAIVPGGPHPLEFVVRVPGFEQPVLWNAALFVPPMITFSGVLDGQGRMAQSGLNPGFPVQLSFVVQVVFLDAPNSIVGTSNPLSLILQ